MHVIELMISSWYFIKNIWMEAARVRDISHQHSLRIISKQKSTKNSCLSKEKLWMENEGLVVWVWIGTQVLTVFVTVDIFVVLLNWGILLSSHYFHSLLVFMSCDSSLFFGSDMFIKIAVLNLEFLKIIGI